jgi:ATP-dependent helicase/nuclease subunit B
MGKAEIWVGPSGSEKSQTIAREIRQASLQQPFGPPIYWVTPASIAFSVEKRLLSWLPSTIRVQVLPLERFAEQILLQSGQVLPELNRTGKRFLLGQVFEEVAPKLSVLKRKRPSVSFLDSILEAFEEFANYAVPEEQLQTIVESAPSVAELVRFLDSPGTSEDVRRMSKVRDLALLYLSYQSKLRIAQWRDASQVVADASLHLKSSTVLDSATVYFDGFVELPSTGLFFVKSVAEAAARTVVTVRANRDVIQHPEFQFWCGEYHAKRVSPYSVVECVERMRTERADLYASGLRLFANLEQMFTNATTRWFFRSGTEWDASCRPQLVVSANPFDEVENAARYIFALHVRKRVPYDQVMVVVPSIEEYRPHIEELFRELDIPMYLEEFPSLATHPLARFLLSVLRVVRDDFSLNAMRCLGPSPFLQMADAEWDELILYAERHELSGRVTWLGKEAWSYALRVLDTDAGQDVLDRAVAEDRRIERVRQSLVGLLLPFVESMEEDLSIEVFSNAVWSLFESARAPGIMAEWIVDAGGQGGPQSASRHEQAWDKIVALLDNLSQIGASQSISRDILFQIVVEDIQQETVASVPAGLSQVTVTTVSRVAGMQSEFLMVLGAIDGSLPKHVRRTVLFDEDDREWFWNNLYIRIGLSEEELRMDEEEHVLELLKMRGSQVILSVPRVSGDGRETRLSTFVQRHLSTWSRIPEKASHELSQRMDGDLELQDFSSLSVSDGKLTITSAVATRWLVQSLRDVVEMKSARYFAPLMKAVHTDAGFRQLALPSLQGFLHRVEREALPADLAEKMYGEVLSTSVHLLEDYYSCPYRHFLRKGLAISETSPVWQASRERGILMHETLATFARYYIERPDQWFRLSEPEAVRQMRSALDETLLQSRFQRFANSPTRRMEVANTARLLDFIATVQANHAQNSAFIPSLVEVSFGLEGDSRQHFPAWTVSDATGRAVRVRGRVDRIDVHSSLPMFRVIDYKSRSRPLDLTRMFYGLQVQLPLYANALTELSPDWGGRSLEAVALQYFPISLSPTLELAPPTEAESRALVRKQLRPSGLVLQRASVVEGLDARLSQGQESDLYAPFYNKDGEWAKNAPVVSNSDWKMIQRKSVEHVQNYSDAVRSGDIAVAPYRLKNGEMPCHTCDFQAVCHFDIKHHASLARRLQPVTKNQFYSRTEFSEREVTE